LHSQGAVQAGPPSALTAKHGATHSHSSSHGAPVPSQAGGESGQNGPFSGALDLTGHGDQSREDKLWTYIRSVHDELSVLRTEVLALRAQLATAQTAGSTTTSPVSGDSGTGSIAPR
jgi:hypothetical protein